MNKPFLPGLTPISPPMLDRRGLLSQPDKITGLLGNPLLMASLGLLSAGRNSTIDPYQAAASGLMQAQQFRDSRDAKKRDDELAKREKWLHEQRMKTQERLDALRPQMARQFGALQGPTLPGEGPLMRQGADPILASLAQVDPMAAAEIYGKRTASPAGKIGIVQPGNYTPESVAKYNQTGRFEDLVPYEPYQTKEIGGVPHLFHPPTGQWLPVNLPGQDGPVTAESVGTNQGTVTATAADVTTAADTKRELGSTKYADDISTLQSELDWIRANKDDFLSIFGAIQGRTPNISQGARDAAAKRDRVANLLTLAARGQLKGQGTVSDFESRMLESAATLFNNPTISDELAWAEFERIQGYVDLKRSRIPDEQGVAAGPPPGVSADYLKKRAELMGE